MPQPAAISAIWESETGKDGCKYKPTPSSPEGKGQQSISQFQISPGFVEYIIFFQSLCLSVKHSHSEPSVPQEHGTKNDC